MKDLLKILGIFFFGLLTAIVIYPILHEGENSQYCSHCGKELRGDFVD